MTDNTIRAVEATINFGAIKVCAYKLENSGFEKRLSLEGPASLSVIKRTG